MIALGASELAEDVNIPLFFRHFHEKNYEEQPPKRECFHMRQN